eukprot:PITA_35199
MSSKFDLGNVSHDCEFNHCTISKPNCFEEAANCDEWKDVMQKEYDALIKNETWRLGDPPESVKPIGCKWMYKIKYKADVLLDKYKARIVAKGYAQKEGVDYIETFAPTAKWGTIRTLFSLVGQNSWKVHHMDVKTIFLNGNLKEDVYMFQPEGFVVKGKDQKDCNPVTTPIEQNLKLTSTEGSMFEDPTKYKKIVGNLNFLTTTRPDIDFVVGILSRFMHKPCEGHWNATKRVLKYLKVTQTYGIKYSEVVDFHLTGYSDSDFDGDKENGVSTSGYLMSLGSATINWRSHKQSISAYSTIEAEYVTSTQATK